MIRRSEKRGRPRTTRVIILGTREIRSIRKFKKEVMKAAVHRGRFPKGLEFKGKEPMVWRWQVVAIECR